MMPVHVQPPRPAAVAAAALPTIVPWRPWTGFASSSKLITSCVYTSRIGVSSRSGTVTPFAGHRRLPAQLLWRQSALQPERASQPAIGNESEDIEEEEEEMEEYEEYEEDGEWDDDGEEGEWDEDEDDLMSSTAAGERTEGANASSSSSSSSSSMRPGIRSIPAEQSSVAYTPVRVADVPPPLTYTHTHTLVVAACATGQPGRTSLCCHPPPHPPPHRCRPVSCFPCCCAG
jgi:hypothetical protein